MTSISHFDSYLRRTLREVQQVADCILARIQDGSFAADDPAAAARATDAADELESLKDRISELLRSEALR